MHQTQKFKKKNCFITDFNFNSTLGSQATPIGRLIKELAKSRRILLVDEFFTTKMCSGCNLSGIGTRHSRMFDNPTASTLSHGYTLRSTSALQIKTTVPPQRHKNHPTCAMATCRRTIEPADMKERRERREEKRAILFPPDPGRPTRRSFDLLSVAIHGIRHCVHCGRFWNRDLNAARNIGWVFIGVWMEGERPAHLQRPSVSTSTVYASEKLFLHPFSLPQMQFTISRKRKQ